MSKNYNFSTLRLIFKRLFFREIQFCGFRFRRFSMKIIYCLLRLSSAFLIRSERIVWFSILFTETTNRNKWRGKKTTVFCTCVKHGSNALGTMSLLTTRETLGKTTSRKRPKTINYLKRWRARLRRGESGLKGMRLHERARFVLSVIINRLI